jgi:hypothetical protein
MLRSLSSSVSWNWTTRASHATNHLTSTFPLFNQNLNQRQTTQKDTGSATEYTRKLTAAISNTDLPDLYFSFVFCDGTIISYEKNANFFCFFFSFWKIHALF